MRRLTALAALLFLLSVGVFALLYASPGNAADVLLGSRPRTPEMVAAVKREYHLDDPLPVQYSRWLTGALHLDFGTSIRTGEPVIALFQRQGPPTLYLVLYALILTMVSGVGLGFLAAYYRGTVLDRLVVVGSVVGASSPAFATAILLIFLFGVAIPLFPVYGSGTGFLGQVYYLTLPALALASTTMAIVAKLTRAALITAFEQDYVSFARAREGDLDVQLPKRPWTDIDFNEPRPCQPHLRGHLGRSDLCVAWSRFSSRVVSHLSRCTCHTGFCAAHRWHYHLGQSNS